MTCDGEGLFGLGGLGFVMAGEYTFFLKEKIAIVNFKITMLIFETYYHLIP
ncbi:hypothetical protein RhiirA4_398901 [Rhizophagus irregularis]|uniref:Uncharacterized protein n=1 Tax=Rhizophagus irregularis TaxID=588596 RepID=A0A2I1GAB0_9GLOM|nr:hypothetical protein RhiirA4_398901 [Rhizophagus irregularis]